MYSVYLVSNRFSIMKSKEGRTLQVIYLVSNKCVFKYNIKSLESKSDIRYSLIFYYSSDKVTFCSAKQLDALVKVY